MNFYKLIDRWHSLVGRKDFADGAASSTTQEGSPTAVMAALSMMNAKNPDRHGARRLAHSSLRERVSETRFHTELVRTDFMGMRPLK